MPSNIQVEITDAQSFHCFKLTLNPKHAECKICGGTGFAPTGGRGVTCEKCQGQGRIQIPGSGIEVMLHASALVDLIHQASVALCQWQSETAKSLILQKSGLSEDEARAAGLIA